MIIFWSSQLRLKTPFVLFRIFIWLHLHVFHHYLSVEQQHWSPTSFFPPIFRVCSLFYVHYLHICLMIFYPLFCFLINYGHKLSFAVMLVPLFGSMIIISSMIHCSNDSIITRGFWVFNGFKEKFMKNILIEQNIIKKEILNFIFIHIFNIWVDSLITVKLIFKGWKSIIHIIRIKHLMPLIDSLLKFFLQIFITEIINIDNSRNSHSMITLTLLWKLNLLPIFMSRRVSPTRSMNKKIFG